MKDKYDSISRISHLLLAIMVIAQLVIGYTINDNSKTLLYIHETMGISIFILMLFKLFWKFTFMHVPVVNSKQPIVKKFIKNLPLIIIYMSLLILPIIGWLGLCLAGEPVWFFGMNLAVNLPISYDSANTVFGMHSFIVIVLIVALGSDLLRIYSRKLIKKR